MRTPLLVSGLILGLVSVSTAMPVAAPPSVSKGTHNKLAGDDQGIVVLSLLTRVEIGQIRIG